MSRKQKSSYLTYVCQELEEGFDVMADEDKKSFRKRISKRYDFVWII
jgi:hypothetical protein